MSALAEQHERWAGAAARLGVPAARAVMRIERPKVVKPKPKKRLTKRERSARMRAPSWFEAPLFSMSAVGEAHFAFVDTTAASREVFITWRQIAREVAQKHGISVTDLISHRRDRHVSIARQEAFWRCKNETTLSLPKIGERFGGRDHSSVWHGILRHKERLRGLVDAE